MGFTLSMESEYWYISLCLLGYLLHFNAKSKFISLPSRHTYRIPFVRYSRQQEKVFFKKLFWHLNFSRSTFKYRMHCLLLALSERGKGCLFNASECARVKLLANHRTDSNILILAVEAQLIVILAIDGSAASHAWQADEKNAEGSPAFRNYSICRHPEWRRNVRQYHMTFS